MEPNREQYPVTRIAVWVGAIAAVILRAVILYWDLQLQPIWAIVPFAIALGIGLFVDLVLRK
jgi:NADH:ubiquinone oxidoreductase subunit 6 (subunit J)